MLVYVHEFDTPGSLVLTLIGRVLKLEQLYLTLHWHRELIGEWEDDRMGREMER